MKTASTVCMRQGRIAGGHSRVQPVVLVGLAVVGRVRLRISVGVVLDPVGVSSNLTKGSQSLVPKPVVIEE
jgi:hypothetical protein